MRSQKHWRPPITWVIFLHFSAQVDCTHAAVKEWWVKRLETHHLKVYFSNPGATQLSSIFQTQQPPWCSFRYPQLYFVPVCSLRYLIQQNQITDIQHPLSNVDPAFSKMMAVSFHSHFFFYICSIVYNSNYACCHQISRSGLFNRFQQSGLHVDSSWARGMSRGHGLNVLRLLCCSTDHTRICIFKQIQGNHIFKHEERLL